MAAEFITPWTGRRDITVLMLRAGKFRPGETRPDGDEPCRQGFEVRHNHPDVSREDLRLTRRQMELLLPDVNPHVFWADHHVGITGKPQPGRVEGLGHFLVGHLHIEVLHTEDVSNVLSCTIVGLLHTRSSPSSPVVSAGTTGYFWVAIAMWGDYTITC